MKARRPGTIARRAQKREMIRSTILEQARLVVGSEGFGGLSIAKIAEASGVALGSIYTYFSSHQDLLESILPSIEDRYFTDRDAATGNAGTYLEFEKADIEAARSFQKRCPEIKKILNEAPHYAPMSFERHLGKARSRYLRRLELSWKSGELRRFREAELPILAEMILWYRYNSFTMFVKSEWQEEKITETYLKFIRGALGLLG